MNPANQVRVIDGGFSTQLSTHVGNIVDGDPLWSSRFNATDQEAVIRTHLDFLYAGAECILTNTYQASVEGYMEFLKLDKVQSIELIKATVRLAHLARTQYLGVSKSDKVPWIVGSIGPYGAHLHDASEYTGSYANSVSAEKIQEWHSQRIEAVIEAGVDCLAVETIPCAIEAETVAEYLSKHHPTMKFWISFQCKEDGQCIANGEPFATAARKIWHRVRKDLNNENLLAIGVNCVNPKFVTPLFTALNVGDDEKIPLIAYPNSGELYDSTTGWSGTVVGQPIEAFIPEWIELGAKFVGGCCRTYARDIERIKKTVVNLQEKEGKS